MKTPIIADENVATEVVALLRLRGWDVLSIGSDHFGVTDEQIVQFAIQTNRLIVTNDRDFGSLIFQHQMKPAQGVLYLRIAEREPEILAGIIDEILGSNDVVFTRTLVVFDGKKIRQRPY